jgi:hypothetical protein
VKSFELFGVVGEEKNGALHMSGINHSSSTVSYN